MKDHQEEQQQQKQKPVTIETHVGEFEIIEDYVDQAPIEKNVQANEANLQQDMQAGQEMVQKAENVPAFAQQVIQPELSMDEQFQLAHKRAHETEEHPAKMKKSTLKKRRKEYEKKTAEQTAMRDLKAQLDHMKNDPVKSALLGEMTGKMGDEKVTVDVNSQYMDQMMDAVMYFSKKESLDMNQKAIMIHDMSFDLKSDRINGVLASSMEERERFTGKMFIYEKLFREAMSWDPEEFKLKDNHAMAKDKDLTTKMEKLNLIPVLKTAIAEYKQMVGGDNDTMKKYRDKYNKDKLFSEDMFKELECRLTYYEDVKAEYDCRIDLMSNKYYSLLGQSDTANLKVPDLERLSKDKNMDPELKAYYDAILRHRSRKDTGRSLKGKSAKSALEKVRKEKNTKKPDARFNSAYEDWERQLIKVDYRNFNKTRQEEFIKRGDYTIDKFKYENEAEIENEMTAVYNSLDVELTAEMKNEIKADFKDKLAASQRTRKILDSYGDDVHKMDTDLENIYNVGKKEKFTDVREERECVIAYLYNKKKEENKSTDRSLIFGRVMGPFHGSMKTLPPDEAETRKKTSAKAMYDIIDELAKEENEKKTMEKILTKYGSPEEFALKCTPEEYSHLMMLGRAGQLINHHIFEHPGDHKYLVEMIEQSQLKDFCVKLKNCAYDTINLINAYMKAIANNNYAFLDKKTMDALYRSKPQDKVKETSNVSVGGKFGIRNAAQNAKGKDRMSYFGKLYEVKIKEVETQFDKDMQTGKWKSTVDLLKKPEGAKVN